MGPTSKVLLTLVVIAAVALIVIVARARRWFVQLAAGLVALALGVGIGVLAVNDYYGYYSTWDAAIADFSGSATNVAVSTALPSAKSTGSATGRVVSLRLPGHRSGINRPGLVYLPPQYFERTFRTVRFPVVELLHGTPGSPPEWVNQVRAAELAEKMIDDRQIGPMVLVMPESNGGVNRQQECLNTPAFQDDTYISHDVPADIKARFRVSPDSAQWGMIGMSSGGYCAANLMLRHPQDYGSAAALDGYFSSHVENAKPIIGSNPILARANDPLAAAATRARGAGPLPAFWVSAGTGDSQDYAYAKAMVAAMRRLEAVPFLVVPGAGHTLAAIRRMLPSAYAWTWEQLASPDQRREFPTVGLRTGQTVVTAPVQHAKFGGTRHALTQTPAHAGTGRVLR